MHTARRTTSYRLALLAGLVFTLPGALLPSTAVAQNNPLDQPSENPLDRPSPPYHGPDLDLPLRLRGEGLTLDIERLEMATAKVAGHIRMGDSAYPFTGAYEDSTRLVGSFDAGAQAYEFTLEGQPGRGFTLKTGQSSYTLRDTSHARTDATDSRAPATNAADPAQLERASDAMAAQDFAAALRIARPLADRGHVGASYLVGMCSAFALGTEQDLDAAKRFFETAARGDHPSALFELGAMANEGVLGEPDNAAAIDYFERAARLGSLGGIMSYGEMLLNGLGREADFAEGISWVGVAAKRGHQDAKQIIDHYTKDETVAQEDRARITQRTAELARTLPDAAELDDLAGYNRFVTPPADARTDDTGERPRAVDPLAGEWTGTLTEQMDNGQTMRAPITLSMTRQADGSYAADVLVEIRMPAGDGSMVDVRATGRFDGRLADDRATLRARDTTATIVQTGETASMGAQQLEFSLNANAITGRLGNDDEGYSQFQATRADAPAGRTGDANRGSAPDPTRGAATGLGRPATAGGVSTAAQVTLEPVTLTDPGMNGAPSHTLLVPEGWNRRGGVKWNPPKLYQDMVHLDLRVTAPDGASFGYYPGAVYTWSDIYQINAQMGIQSQTPRPGQITSEGLTFMPMPQTTGDYVQSMLIPQQRPNATNVRVTEAQEMPEVLATMREMLAPTLQSMQQHNQSMGQMGGGRMEMPLFADRVRVTYRENGRQFVEDVYVTGYAVISRIQLSGGQVTTMAKWGIQDARMVRTPADGSPNRAIADAASLSVRPDPKWLATIMQLKAQINKTVSDGIIERGRITRQAMQESFERHQETVRARQESNDKLHHQFINYIRDVEDYRTPGGKVVQLPNQYNNAYMNGQGQVIMTNTPMSSTSGWTQLNRVNP